MHRFFIFYTGLLLAATFGFLGYNIVFVEPSVYVQWGVEYGPVEMAAAIVFGMAAALAAVIACLSRREIWWLFAFLMLAAMFREMDWHKALTQDSILKSNFYLKSDAPLIEKIGGALFIIILVCVAWRLLSYVRRWLSNLLRFKPMAVSIFLALGFMTVAKTFDSMARLFPGGAAIKAEYGQAMGLIEETFELTSAALFLCVCLLYFIRPNRP